MEKKKSNLSPEAAKILEQYRNAGKKTRTNADGTPIVEEEDAIRPTTPPPLQPMRRSGTRGK